jgi:hypothetical protein
MRVLGLKEHLRNLALAGAVDGASRVGLEVGEPSDLFEVDLEMSRISNGRYNVY